MIKTYFDNLGIRSIEWHGLYLRTGAHFILTATWHSWGIEVCRCHSSEPWAPWGSVSRQVRVRLGNIRLWVFLGQLPKITVPDLSNRRLAYIGAGDALIGPVMRAMNEQVSPAPL